MVNLISNILSDRCEYIMRFVSFIVNTYLQTYTQTSYFDQFNSECCQPFEDHG